MSVMLLDPILGGFEPIGIDGLVVFATLLVFILCVVSRRSAPRTAEPAGRDKQDLAPAMPAKAMPADISPERTMPGVSGLLALPDRVASRVRLSRATVSALVLIAGLCCVWIGQRDLAQDARPWAYVPWFVGLALIIAVCAQLPYSAHPEAASSAQGALRGYWRLVLAVFVAGAAVVLWKQAQQRALDDASLDLVALWIAAMGALAIAVVAPIRRDAIKDTFRQVQRNRAEAATITGIALVAFACRTVALSSYPRVVTGDEGMFGMAARSVLRGDLRNPFASATGGYPSLLFITQSGVMKIAGDNIAGARGQSALLGTGVVLAVYALTRHHFGRGTALIAATLAATNSFAIFWSRNTQNAIAPMLFFPLALLFLDRGLVGRRRTDSLVAGLVIGFAQYFHPGNRLLVPLAAAYLVYAVLYPLPRTRGALAASVRSVTLPAVIVVSATLISFAPQFGYYWARPDEYWNRINQVSAFSSGWLDREVESSGLSMAHLLWIQFRNAAMLPFSTPPSGLFRPGIPFVSWPMAVPVAIGLGLVTVTFWRRSSFGFVIGFWSTVVGLALTEGPAATNRYVAAGPFLVIFGALGISVIALALERFARLPRRSTMLAAGLVTVLIAAWHLNFYFRDPNQIEVYADTNAVIATSIARQTNRLGPDATLYFLGQPRMYYQGNENMAFLAPDATVFDIERPWPANEKRPVLTGTTLFTFLPDRLPDLEIVRGWFPGGTETTHVSDSGELLYVSYLVDADAAVPAGAVNPNPDAPP